jgi:hypothetical protein
MLIIVELNVNINRRVYFCLFIYLEDSISGKDTFVYSSRIWLILSGDYATKNNELGMITRNCTGP